MQLSKILFAVVTFTIVSAAAVGDAEPKKTTVYPHGPGGRGPGGYCKYC